MYNHFERAWDFEVITPTQIMNINRIHPLKQKEVVSIVESLKNNNKVLRIVVFGSAVEFRCTSRSDIDIYVETDEEECKITLPYDTLVSEVDVVRNLNHKTRLFEQIEKTGIVVYERRSENV